MPWLSVLHGCTVILWQVGDKGSLIVQELSQHINVSAMIAKERQVFCHAGILLSHTNTDQVTVDRTSWSNMQR